MFEFKFADIGEGIHEGTILKWNFKVGDKVNEGDTLVIVETDKVNAELPSPVTGTIVSLGAKEGDTIHVGQTVVTIDDGKGDVAPAPAPVQEAKPAPAPETTPSQAAYDFKFADIGEGIHEGTILKWNFKEGDAVKEGETLVIVETDKVNAELPAPVSGTILKIGKKEGEVIHVGETVVLIGEKGATLAPAEATTKQHAEPASEPKKGAGVVGEIQVSDDIIASSDEVEGHVATTGKVLASPVARKLAADLGVDIATVKGTGEQGRVLKDDVASLGTAKVSAPQPAQVAPTPAPVQTATPVAAPQPTGDVEVVKISRLRKAISNAMTRSHAIIPDTVLMDEINVNELVAFRNATKGLAESKGIKLTYMAFIAKAVVIALKEFPMFNASFNHETDEVYIKKTINLGIAVDTPDGLIVPNVKSAEKLSVFELAGQIRKLADDTIARKITLDQQQHGTFTITNFGSVGISFGTPVINYPEVAILGVGKIEQKPWVIDGEIKIAHTLPLSLAVDHRIIDGADGGRFLMRVKELLSNPTLMLLS